MSDHVDAPEEAVEAALARYGGVNVGTVRRLLRVAAPDIRKQERERVREALKKAILESAEDVHHGSLAHDGTTEIHEAEREALERFRNALDSLEDPDA